MGINGRRGKKEREGNDANKLADHKMMEARGGDKVADE
jgi:hypothetical protein